MLERAAIRLGCRLAAGLAAAFAIFATLISLAPAAFAQGCVMCYTSASAASKRGERALDHAIIALLLPVLSLFVGILVFAWRRSRAASARSAEITGVVANSLPENELPLSWLPHTH